MRLKKGTKVEVFTQKEVPPGSWRYAEIIGGDGRYYIVRYDDMGNFGDAMVEKVAQKAIRPCPPMVDVMEDWVPGDVVEVFHNFSWKMATVLKLSGRNHLVVRLLGSAIEFKTNKCIVRARLCWQDGEWMVIGKASGKSEDLRFRLPSSRTDNNRSQRTGTKVDGRVKGDNVSSRNINCALTSHAIPSMTLKRKPSDCHEEIKAYAGQHKKVRVGKKNNTRLHFNIVQQPQLPEKVDDVACSKKKLAENCLHSFVDKVTGSSKHILERERTNRDVENSVTSSVGSCSVDGNYSHKLHHVFSMSRSKDNEHECSDAESFCRLETEEENCVLPAKEDLPEEIHRLELHAYRCIIEALHASGPLSWELELLLTNLRDSLHISVDEHLMEIRNLVPSSACIPSS